MPSKYTIGLDFGTNSVRALLVDVKNGKEIASHIFNYPHGEAGIIVDPRDPNLARQHPGDYLDGIEKTVKALLKEAASVKGVSPDQVIGIGVDTTGSTPIPIDEAGEPLAFRKEFAKDPAAMAWLWKDHTGHAEAEQITVAAAQSRPQYLAKCGGRYSSEWFWSKILRCARVAPKVFDAAYTWVECSDWVPAVLSGTTKPDQLKRGICAAGHKAMCNPKWGGYPDEQFLAGIDPRLAKVRKSLPNKTYTVADAAGGLCKAWSKKLGLPRRHPRRRRRV